MDPHWSRHSPAPGPASALEQQPFGARPDRGHMLGQWLTSPHLISPLILALTILQAALLHPRFEGSPGARWIRAGLAPLTISWWISLPFRAPALPVEANPGRNMVNGLAGCVLALKAFEWSFASGPYRSRKLVFVGRTPMWTKQSPVDKTSDQQSGWVDILGWLALVMSSSRGLRFSWGYPCVANTATCWDTLAELVRLHFLSLSSLAFVLLSFSAPGGSPYAALLSLGIPQVFGLRFFAYGLHSFCLGLFVSYFMEFQHQTFVLSLYFLHPLAIKVGLPHRFCEACNPLNHPRLFGPLFELSSLAHFWGKSWHQKLRRSFVVCGSKPAAALARALGASPRLQQVVGLFGAFAVSGLVHEYGLWVVFQPPHPHAMSPLQNFPGTFLFFILQPVGILLEKLFLPHIPARLAQLWTLAFLLLSSVGFSKDMCRQGGLLSLYKPLKQWTLVDLFIPAMFKSLHF